MNHIRQEISNIPEGGFRDFCEIELSKAYKGQYHPLYPHNNNVFNAHKGNSLSLG